MLGTHEPTLVCTAHKYTMASLIAFDGGDGPYAAMNQGATLASGKYLWFLNAGDIPLTESIPTLINNALYNTSPLISCVCTMCNGSLERSWIPRLEDLPLGTLPHPSLLFSRELFALMGGFNHQYTYVADRALLVSAFLAGQPINFLPIAIARYVSSRDSMSSTYAAAYEDIGLTFSLGLFPTAESLKDLFRKALLSLSFPKIMSEASCFYLGLLRRSGASLRQLKANVLYRNRR